MFTKIILASLSIVVASTAGVAASTPAEPSKGQRAEAEKNDATKYCLSYERMTGSRVESTLCKTKREWAREGVNVDQPSN